MANKDKVDIFDALNKLSNKDSSFYDQLEDQQQKALQPIVVMRWLTGTSDPKQVFFINELVNTKAFSLYQHPKLLYQLMTVCTPGVSRKYQWNKKHKKQSSFPLCNQLVQQYYGYNSNHAEQALPLLDNDDLLTYAQQLGWQSDQLKQLNKELKTRSHAAAT